MTGTDQFTLDGAHTPLTSENLAGVAPDWTTTTTYNTAGQVVAQTDQYAVTTYTLYDVRGNVVETRTQAKDAAGASVWLATRTAYDANGRAVAVTDPFVVTNIHNPLDPAFSTSGDSIVTLLADRRVMQTIYDSVGRVVETRRLAGVGISLATDSVAGSTVPIYVTTYTGPSGSALATAIRSRSETIYDAQGQVVPTENPIRACRGLNWGRSEGLN